MGIKPRRERCLGVERSTGRRERNRVNGPGAQRRRGGSPDVGTAAKTRLFHVAARLLRRADAQYRGTRNAANNK